MKKTFIFIVCLGFFATAKSQNSEKKTVATTGTEVQTGKPANTADAPKQTATFSEKPGYILPSGGTAQTDKKQKADAPVLMFTAEPAKIKPEAKKTENPK